MAGPLDSHDGPISSINVTPFVDVVLVLLVVLMVTSTEIARSAIAVDLPSAAAPGSTVPRTLNIVIRADGDLELDGAPVTPTAMTGIVTKARRTSPELRAVISADRQVAYDHVIEVIDLVKGCGVDKFALDVERRSDAG